MPKTLVDECPAGPEMDAAVAEAADWVKNFLYDRDGLPKRTAYVDPSDDYREVVRDIATWHPSTDIAAAWKMESTLEVDQQADYVMALFNLVAVDLGAPDSCAFKKAVYWRMAHASPLDRCRAFLKANGIEYIEVSE